jgi:hypothetical protein
MATWITLVIWVVANLFGLTFATPLAQSVRTLVDTNNTATTALIVCYREPIIAVSQLTRWKNVPPYTHSIQILLKRDRGDYYYEFWKGREGVAVGACGDENFTNFIGMGPYRGDPGMINNPAYPPKVSQLSAWALVICTA